MPTNSIPPRAAIATAWDRHIGGHVDDGTGRCSPDQRGFTYQVSSWRDRQGRRMILISEVC
jgi:hypothetical protein